jgi:hypothetical protein
MAEPEDIGLSWPSMKIHSRQKTRQNGEQNQYPQEADEVQERLTVDNIQEWLGYVIAARRGG